MKTWNRNLVCTGKWGDWTKFLVCSKGCSIMTFRM